MRKLSGYDTSFSKIRNEVIKNLAIQELLDNRDSVETIAQHPGFESPPNFTRFFKNMTGESPYRFRQLKRSFISDTAV